MKKFLINEHKSVLNVKVIFRPKFESSDCFQPTEKDFRKILSFSLSAIIVALLELST